MSQMCWCTFSCIEPWELEHLASLDRPNSILGHWMWNIFDQLTPKHCIHGRSPEQWLSISFNSEIDLTVAHCKQLTTRSACNTHAYSMWPFTARTFSTTTLDQTYIYYVHNTTNWDLEVKLIQKSKIPITIPRVQQVPGRANADGPPAHTLVLAFLR